MMTGSVMHRRPAPLAHRMRLLEHLRGEHRCHEIDRGDFGVLRESIHENRALVTEVIGLIEAGAENLSVIVWAAETGRDLDAVVTILSVLDINARRLPRCR
jgi:hypothetical protein